MLFADVATASGTISATSKRLAKVAAIAAALAAAEPAEIGLVVWYLSGELRQRRTGVGYATLRDLPEPAAEPTLTVAQVDARIEEISQITGAGSQSRRRAAVEDLWGRTTAPEQRLLVGLISGELRQGAQAGVMVDAVIKASGLPAGDVRHAVMLSGTIAPVAEAVLTEGEAGLRRFTLVVGRPLRPMLATSATDMAAAFEKIDGPAAVEWKVDGIRVQVHAVEGRVSIFTRTLDDVTDRLPEIVEAVAELPVRSVVLDGEVIALDESDGSGRPRPFQVTAARTASGAGDPAEVARLRRAVPLRAFFFDVLHLDGEDLIARPADERTEALARAVPEPLRIPRMVTTDVSAGERFAADAVARGHEGAMVKALDADYSAGRRGVGWIKVKPRHTLDLVILAAEWGHGRRTGLLSNLHLGARNPADGSYVMLGKTFKGLTDEMLRWQTERLLGLRLYPRTDLADHDDGDRGEWVVHVRPELVVEIAFDGVQTSRRYPAGMALRFARVLRYREDKTAEEVDTVETVAVIHAQGHGGALEQAQGDGHADRDGTVEDRDTPGHPVSGRS